MRLRSTDSTKELAAEIIGRLSALGRAHDMVRPINASDGQVALLGDLLTILLAPYDDQGAFAGRLRVAVPRMGIGSNTSTALALVIYEFATNSLKYEALSQESGTLDISCVLEEAQVVLNWTERGGPPVTAPSNQIGFGSGLVVRSVERQLGGSVLYDWCADGLIITLRMNRSCLST